MLSEFLEAMELGTVERGGYQNGRVVDLSLAAQKPLYLVGDIHAKFGRISHILAHAQLEPLLASEQAVLVFLGDLFHREDDDRAGEMESSIETLNRVMALKVRYPRSVFILLGNHEFTRSGSTKRGYFQGQLFRAALKARGLAEGYDRFLQLSPLVMIHPRYVGVHAGPAVSVTSLEELYQLEVRDVDPSELPPAVRQLAFSRHIDWSPNPSKFYTDTQIREFLALCGVPDGRLLTGHTPLDRDTAWNWDIGAHLTVIFAAGREVGYFRVTPEGDDLVRVGRSCSSDDEIIIPDRAPRVLPEGPGQRLEVVRGRARVILDDPTVGVELLADVCYRFTYPEAVINLARPDGESLRICQYRHLSAASQAYYAQGYYLVGNEFRQEVLKLKTELAVLLGGSSLVEGVRFSWGDEEFAILRQEDEGVFEVRPLIPGIRLG
jgi:hypothetical protein